MESKPDSPKLKILIASTPRTGNTWLKLLLSEIYDLPIVSLPEKFDRSAIEDLGERWIGHQHYYPVPDLLACAQENQITLATTVRHPADILISLFHYIRNQPNTPASIIGTATLLGQDGGEMGPNTTRYVRNSFYLTLDVSVYWVLSRSSRVVRYEQLWSDPFGTLTELTDEILSVTRDRIRHAIVRCDLDTLRQRFDPDALFFRSGRVEEGLQTIPSQILDIFRSGEPYPHQFAILGYDLHQNLGVEAGSKTRPIMNPFVGRREFDNGVPISQTIAELYWKIENGAERWPRPLQTEGADSFLAWLNGSAEADPFKDSRPSITNLLAYLHQSRVDLQRTFPDPFGKDRSALAEWFITHGQREYSLSDAFIEPGREVRPRKRASTRRRRQVAEQNRSAVRAPRKRPHD